MDMRFAEAPGGRIELEHVKVGMLRDTRENWPENINLLGFEYGRFHSEAEQDVTERLDWLSRCPQQEDADGRKRFDPEPYEQLANVYRKTGRLDDARTVLIEKEERSNKHIKGWLQRFARAAWGELAD